MLLCPLGPPTVRPRSQWPPTHPTPVPQGPSWPPTCPLPVLVFPRRKVRSPLNHCPLGAGDRRVPAAASRAPAPILHCPLLPSPAAEPGPEPWTHTCPRLSCPLLGPAHLAHRDRGLRWPQLCLRGLGRLPLASTCPDRLPQPNSHSQGPSLTLTPHPQPGCSGTPAVCVGGHCGARASWQSPTRQGQ